MNSNENMEIENKWSFLIKKYRDAGISSELDWMNEAFYKPSIKHLEFQEVRLPLMVLRRSEQDRQVVFCDLWLSLRIVQTRSDVSMLEKAWGVCKRSNYRNILHVWNDCMQLKNK